MSRAFTQLKSLLAMPALSLVGLWLLLAPSLSAHNVYNSFSQLDWNDADGSIELVMQIHSHELETKLSLLADRRLSFLDDADFDTLQTATRDYVKNNIAVRLDDTLVELMFLGIETDGLTVIAYLEADWSKQPKQIEFMNSIFLGDIPEQVNSVLATVKGERKGGDITEASGPVNFVFTP